MMKVTYYDEFTRLTRLKPAYAWSARILVAGSFLAFMAKVLAVGVH